MRPSTRRVNHQYYHCNGTRQPTPVCDERHSFHVALIDNLVWAWLRDILEYPENVLRGLYADRQEAERHHSQLLERMVAITQCVQDCANRRARDIVAYEHGALELDELVARKHQIEKEISDLDREKASLQEHLDAVIISDAQLEAIEAICSEIRIGLNEATFEDKKRYFELLDVRGLLTLEDGKETVYIKCKLAKQQRLQMETWPLLNTGVNETAS